MNTEYLDLLILKNNNKRIPFLCISQLLVSAYDTGAPLAVVRETVTIIVNRNLNTPLFDKQLYEETVNDFEPVGSSVLVVTARDADITSPENQVSYDIVSTSTNTLFEMFAINPGSGLITINRALTTESINNYRVSCTLFYFAG
ncbi:hypothetical protein DPMN_036503 [Dreissena polymorpha]|uniref:Cadherin domain-containing protein n=1 Tax=Dreissena polymorpha TaxID=45954 RepID=A0A9D4RNW3_DREPO|nr:hypothetical protein DPMN_036503 [Dreissena polymorpha]